MTDIEKKAAEAAEQYIKPLENIGISDTIREMVRHSYSRGYIAGYTTRVEESQWIDIEQAPKDKSLLLYVPGVGVDIGSYDNIQQFWRYNWRDYESIQPTHFMPLPHPPTVQP